MCLEKTQRDKNIFYTFLLQTFNNDRRMKE